MHDINDRSDVELLVNTFYDKVKVDKTIGYIFNTIIGSDWTHHLPLMYNFWEMILFNKPTYQGQPIKKHIEIDKKLPLEKAHFERWLELWNETVDSLFEGARAAEARNRAALMANLIHIKVEMSRNNNFIQ